MKLKLNFLFLLLFFAITIVNSQELDSISMTFEGGKVVVRYDFLVGEEKENYELYLFGSHDNFSEPLQHTTGDVGKNIQLGTGKTIYWDAKKELGNFKGDFNLKIKGSKYIPLVTFENIDQELKIKRGDDFEVRWEPNTKNEKVLIKMQRNGVPIAEPLIVENSGRYNWEVPPNLNAGKGYTVQILDTKNLIKEETSESFKIRRKIPVAYKIVPAMIAAGVAAVIITNERDQGIPGPPAPPSR